MQKPDYQNEYFNIASYLPYMAQFMPYKRAVIFPDGRDKNGRVTYSHLTFAQLNNECDKIADGLSKYGIKKGMRVLFMIPPSLDFIATAFALFKIGAVPIMIDPGMGKLSLLKCIEMVEPEAVVAIPLVHAVKSVFKKYFKSVKYNVTVGTRWFWGGLTLETIKNKGNAPFEYCQTKTSDPAAILFTSGSTGPAKGVLYEHSIFGAQVALLNSFFNFSPDEIDLSAFPLFALFDVALGMSCVVPDMDPTKPAFVNPAKIVEAIKNQGITSSFGSPAIWIRVADYCIEKGIVCDSMKRILIAGAPVSGAIVEKVKRMLPADAEVFTPYGATESLPLCAMRGAAILNETWPKTREGAGICVGKPNDAITARIIKISDDPIENFSDEIILKPFEIGEITVSGPVVTKEYFRNADATLKAKIKDGDKIWHRMGDVGYIDDSGRIWFCGRKNHRVVCGEKTYFSIRCEAIFNNHPDVFRSALVGAGEGEKRRPVIVIEPRPNKFPKLEIEKLGFEKELLEMAKKSEITKDINDILFIEKMPVDIRHNAKIFREKLESWAGGILK